MPGKYKVFKIRFDKTLVDKISFDSFIEDRIYSVLIYCTSCFVLAILIRGNMNTIMLMFIYVMMNVLFKRCLKQIASGDVKLIIYGLINAIPVVYLGLILVGEGTPYLIVPMIATYIVAYKAFVNNSKIVINDALKSIIMGLIWLIVVFIAPMLKGSTYVISLAIYYLMNYIVFNSFLEIKYVLRNNMALKKTSE